MLLAGGTAAGTLSPSCVGDCNGDGSVRIAELVQCVGAALGVSDLAGCSACDQDESGDVSIGELIRGVAIALGIHVRVTGPCRVPGTTGLVPCPPDTPINAGLCDTASTCLGGGVPVLPGGCVGATPDVCIDGQGNYIYEISDCHAVGAALLVSAVVDPDPVATVVYRGIGFGGADTEPVAVAISPMSEAAVQIIADLGPVELTPGFVSQLTDAVVEADSALDFGTFDLGPAIDISVQTASQDPRVRDVLDLGLIGTAVSGK
jgi:hypothetical protein